MCCTFDHAIDYWCLQLPAVYKAIHAKHHERKVQRATEALRLSIVEEVIDVACSIAAVNITGAHALSRTVYNIVIVWLLIELHSGAASCWALFVCLPFTCDLTEGFRPEQHNARPTSHGSDKLSCTVMSGYHGVM